MIHHPPAGDTAIRTAIVGAGFGGLGAAVRLLEEGFDDLVIYDAGDEVGGTWRDNTYPGVACDIPAHLYSYSFHTRGDWSTAYPRQSEIKRYLEDVADTFELRPHLRLGRRVTDARFDEADGRWHLTTSDGGRDVVDAVVAALGPLRVPSYPDLAGRGDFEGTELHTARWDHDVDLEGRRVVVIGTGASGVQVVPPIADRAAQVTVFQRSAPWIIPMFDREYSPVERWVLENVPVVRSIYRKLLYWQKEVRFAGFKRGSPAMRLMEAYARWNMRRQIGDPEMRRQLEPDYRMGCKRILLSNRYYSALNRPHVDLVTDPIERITPDGVLTADGEHVPADVIVYATGFQVANVLDGLTVSGRQGRDLETVWADRPVAYLGTTIPGFPNLYTVLGPNTGLGHNSMVFMMECQYDYILSALRPQRHPGVAYLEVRPEALDRYVAEIEERTQDTVWATGCTSWYLSDEGTNFTLWPGYTFQYWRRTRGIEIDRYRVVAEHELPDRAPSPGDLRPAG